MVMPIKDIMVPLGLARWEAGDRPPCQPQRSAPELSDRPRRRTFTVGDKLRVLAEIDRAPAGGTGAILRRGDIVLPEMLPDASLGLRRCVVNKWNPWFRGICASVPVLRCPP
jgi:hypothetical protein